jgi:hypothetical protein
MKKSIKISLFALTLLGSAALQAQAFIASVEDEGLATLYGNPCTVQLKSGEEVIGKFAGGTYVKDGLSKITIKLENEEKVKYMPDQVMSLRIKASEWVRLAMVTSKGSSMSEIGKTSFTDIMNRDSIIFQSELAAKKKDTPRLLQLVNPGFDTRIKVYAEPSAKTGGFTMAGIPISGGEDRAYLFVKGVKRHLS